MSVVLRVGGEKRAMIKRKSFSCNIIMVNTKTRVTRILLRQKPCSRLFCRHMLLSQAFCVYPADIYLLDISKSAPNMLPIKVLGEIVHAVSPPVRACESWVGR
jgi:hypothetical protein